MIPFQEVEFSADFETVRKFQKDFNRNKAFMTSRKKVKDNQIFCVDTDCIEMFSTEEELDQRRMSQKHVYLHNLENKSSAKINIKKMFAQKLKECQLGVKKQLQNRHVAEGSSSGTEQL